MHKKQKHRENFIFYLWFVCLVCSQQRSSQVSAFYPHQQCSFTTTKSSFTYEWVQATEKKFHDIFLLWLFQETPTANCQIVRNQQNISSHNNVREELRMTLQRQIIVLSIVCWKKPFSRIWNQTKWIINHSVICNVFAFRTVCMFKNKKYYPEFIHSVQMQLRSPVPV